MLLKYRLIVKNESIDIPETEIRNWDEISCTFKRQDYGGVIRSFSSEFVFTGETAAKLMSLYLEKGLFAKASVEVYAITERWRWQLMFTSDFDFSTVKVEDYSFSIGCVDNSLAALIKANKSTTYEFIVGKDILPEINVRIPRLPLIESAQYQFTKEFSAHTSHNDGSVCVQFPQDSVPYIGRIGEPDVENVGIMEINKSQHGNTAGPEDPDNTVNYLLRNIRVEPIQVTLEYNFRVSKLRKYHQADIALIRVNANGTKDVIGIMVPKEDFGGDDSALLPPTSEPSITFDGFEVPYYDKAPPEPTGANQFAVVNGNVWISREQKSLPLPGSTIPPMVTYYWVNVGPESDDSYSIEYKGSLTCTLNSMDKLQINAINFGNNYYNRWVGRCFLYGQNMRFTWQTASLETTVIQGISPQTVAKAIIGKMGEAVKSYVEIDISDHDTRLADTYLFPAETIRNIPGGKLYSSFKNFTEWMETVFGYVYETETGIKAPKYGEIMPFAGLMFATATDLEGNTPGIVHPIPDPYIGDVDPANIYYYIPRKMFAYVPDGINIYLGFPGDEKYNSMRAMRTDTIFLNYSNDKYYMATDEAMSRDGIVEYIYNEDDFSEHPLYRVHFLHRSELFNDEKELTVECGNALSMSVTSENIFATLNIGYKLKNYDKPSGRDEFNFNTTYSTGCTYSDKTLTMQSPYRADSYGVEFCIRQAGDDSTDDKADKDLFFIMVELDDNFKYTPSYVGEISGVNSQRVFNRMFSPMACVEANKEYLGMLANSTGLDLVFSSSEGNSSVVINGQAMTDTIHIDRGFATCANVEFESMDLPDIGDFTTPVKVSHGGFTYKGYIMDLDIKYALNGAAEYKLIVKDIV